MFLALTAAALGVTAPEPISIDFDGDGLMDRVVVEERRHSLQLVAYRAADPQHAVPIVQVSDPNSFVLQVIEAGTYATACGKGAGPDRDCGAAEVTFKQPSIGFGTAESSLIAARWDGKGFHGLALAD